MSVAVNRACFVALFITACGGILPANAQYFSSSGRGGHDADFFLSKVEESGIKNNLVVSVIRSSNSDVGRKEEYLINCNPYMAQVVDGNDNPKTLDIRSDPSSADQFVWELWYAACKKQYAKISKRSPIQKKLSEIKDVKKFDFDGLAYELKFRKLDYRKALANMVPASFDRLDGKRNNPLLVYCSVDTPTVYWAEFKQLVGVDEGTGFDLNKGLEARLVSLSKEIWEKTCQQEKQPHNVSANQQLPDNTADITGQKPARPAPVTSAEIPALKEVYYHYIITSEMCHLGLFGDMKIQPLKEKLKAVDDMAKKHSISVDEVWADAVKSTEQDTNYQLAQMYKAVPMTTSDRLQFTEGCEQMSRLLEGFIDAHIQKYSGEPNTIKKDF